MGLIGVADADRARFVACDRARCRAVDLCRGWDLVSRNYRPQTCRTSLNVTAGFLGICGPPLGAKSTQPPTGPRSWKSWVARQCPEVREPFWQLMIGDLTAAELVPVWASAVT